MTDVLQQGYADGLCGLYCIANFLHRIPEWGDPPNSTLWHLLDACRHFGWLNPYTITEGFEDFQLKAVLDLQIENYRMSYKTGFLSDTKQSSKIKSVNEFLEKVVEAKGAAIVNSQRRKHWMLVMPGTKGGLIVDSANVKEPERELGSVKRTFSPDWGVLILPHQRPSTEMPL